MQNENGNGGGGGGNAEKEGRKEGEEGREREKGREVYECFRACHVGKASLAVCCRVSPKRDLHRCLSKNTCLQVYGVTLFFSFCVIEEAIAFPQWFRDIILLAVFCSTFPDFKPYLICERGEVA